VDDVIVEKQLKKELQKRGIKMTTSSFFAKIRMRGNSATVTIPKGVADVYGVGSEVQVTLNHKVHLTQICSNGHVRPMSEFICVKCGTANWQTKEGKK